MNFVAAVVGHGSEFIHWKDTAVFAQEYIYDAQLLTTDDGLANLMTTAFFQDKKGYLWIGTDRGLNRYDGYGFQLNKWIGSNTLTFFNPTRNGIW